MYLLRVVDGLHEPTDPKANIPTVELPAAEPRSDAALAAVADPLRQLENVYLLRVDETTYAAYPSANIAKLPV